MRKEYDFSQSRKNPYAVRLKRAAMLRYLRRAANKRRPAIEWPAQPPARK